MNKQAGAIMVSILFAVGTVGGAYAVESANDASKSTKSSNSVKKDDGSPTDTRPNTKTATPKVTEGSNAVPEGGTPPQKVTGKLVKIDGKNYVVKDKTGKEVRFMIDERTRMDAAQIKAGDMIRAQIEPQGYAYSVNLATDSTEAGTFDKPIDPLAKKSKK